PALHSFVRGLRRDHDAVTAGLTLPWSSGAVEPGVDTRYAPPAPALARRGRIRIAGVFWLRLRYDLAFCDWTIQFRAQPA
ncbi:hypothetical protein ACWCPQ_34210, partial [Nocardia sp. NPDC001965]